MIIVRNSLTNPLFCCPIVQAPSGTSSSDKNIRGRERSIAWRWTRAHEPERRALALICAFGSSNVMSFSDLSYHFSRGSNKNTLRSRVSAKMTEPLTVIGEARLRCIVLLPSGRQHLVALHEITPGQLLYFSSFSRTSMCRYSEGTMRKSTLSAFPSCRFIACAPDEK